MLHLKLQKKIGFDYSSYNYQDFNDKAKRTELTLSIEHLLFISNIFHILKDILLTESRRDNNMLKLMNLQNAPDTIDVYFFMLIRA